MASEARAAKSRIHAKGRYTHLKMNGSVVAGGCRSVAYLGRGVRVPWEGVRTEYFGMGVSTEYLGRGMSMEYSWVKIRTQYLGRGVHIGRGERTEYLCEGVRTEYHLGWV